jgi:hypothetical protein
LRIESYFQQVREVIDGCSVVRLSNIHYDKRGTHEGLIRGELTFIDESVLHFREYIDVEITVDRLMYVYHYASASAGLIFRYDNTGHHRKLMLPTYPHHKHVGEDGEVTESSAPYLVEVLEEIERSVKLP